MNPLVIYHGNCADGFGAAWAVWKAHPDWEFYAGVHQNPPPDVSGRAVFMVDFSYKRAVIETMLESAECISIIDHHETAMADLADFAHPKLAVTFDMERSGAGMAWDIFHGVERPRLINHIEDRDLWRFALEGTREIQAALFSYPYDFTVWDTLVAACEQDPDRLICEGMAIERKHHKDIAELVGVVTRPMKFRYPPNDGPAPADLGYAVVPMANLPYTLTSDAGHLLCGDEYPFAGCYWDTPDGRVFSLRSRDDGANVGAIAKQYGGGGHAHASGFRIPFDQLAQFEA